MKSTEFIIPKQRQRDQAVDKSPVGGITPNQLAVPLTANEVSNLKKKKPKAK